MERRFEIEDRNEKNSIVSRNTIREKNNFRFSIWGGKKIEFSYLNLLSLLSLDLSLDERGRFAVELSLFILSRQLDVCLIKHFDLKIFSILILHWILKRFIFFVRRAKYKNQSFLSINQFVACWIRWYNLFH